MKASAPKGPIAIGHFRVPKTLTFKMRPSVQPFLWKWVLFAWEWKIISISKAEYLTSFWYRGPEELENGPLNCIKWQKHALPLWQKISPHKCRSAAFCINRSDNRKDLTFHVFPWDPCRRLVSPLCTFQRTFIYYNCSRNNFCRLIFNLYITNRSCFCRPINFFWRWWPLGRSFMLTS